MVLSFINLLKPLLGLFVVNQIQINYMFIFHYANYYSPKEPLLCFPFKKYPSNFNILSFSKFDSYCHNVHNFEFGFWLKALVPLNYLL